MANLTLFNIFKEDLAKGKHDFSTHTFKVMLTNTLPVVTNTVRANITQIANGNGYTTDGLALTCSLSSASGVTKVLITDKVITASGAMGPYRYAVVVNGTTSGGPLVGFIDLGEARSMVNLDTETLDFNGTAGAITIGA